MILQPHGRLKQRLTFTTVQIAAVLGLESLVQAAGLILVCPRCLSEGDPFLKTDNGPHSQELKIDCGCRERRIAASDVGRAMNADGDLIAAAEQILGPISLAVRCPERKCVTHPLEIERSETGTIVRCRCAKTTLHPPRPQRH
jgi:hypothetical protein